MHLSGGAAQGLHNGKRPRRRRIVKSKALACTREAAGLLDVGHEAGVDEARRIRSCRYDAGLPGEPAWPTDEWILYANHSYLQQG
jgi:hypothetical protein